MIKMEETGPEGVKRQRLDTLAGANPVRRMHQQHPDSSIPLPLHNHSQGHALNPPNAYRQALPNSPFPHGEGPPVPEQPPHGGFAHAPLTHQHPNRDPRSLPEQSPTYSRNGSIVGPIRSPEEGHHLRPLTTSFESEHQHYSQHTNPEIGEQHPTYTPHEGPPHGSFHGLPMTHPSHEPGHGHPPVGAMPPYADQEMVHGHHSQSHYHQPPYSASSAGTPWSNRQSQSQIQSQPRKSARAQQACDNCRTRKAKCDEGKPTCSYCKETNQVCVYKEVQPAKADRAQKEIMDTLRLQEDNVQGLRRELSDFKQWMTAYIRSNEASRPRSRALEFEKQGPTIDGAVLRSPQRSRPLTPKTQDVHTEQEDTAMYEFDSGDTPANSVAIDHSTGVHRLLRWPTIKRLLESNSVRSYVKRPLDENFVMQLEHYKGVLRLYGRGQGIDRDDGASTTPASPATSTTSASKSDEGARSPAASPSNIWGANIGPPNMVDGKFSNNTTDDHPGGLTTDGNLKCDKTTMDMLFKSYMDNIHILHPFIDKIRVRRMFDKFYNQTHPTESQSQLRSPFMYHNSIIHSDAIISPATRKRKLSTGDSPRESSRSDSTRNGPEPIVERRISTAIVLLVMALGKISAHKEFLAGPVPDVPRDLLHGQPTSSPFNDSPAFKLSPQGIGSPLSMGPSESRSMSYNPRSSSEQTYTEGTWKDNRNVDVIPGLAYYAKAVEILGYLQGSTDLASVQACLLASLYMGQLACSIESWSWIGQACKSCLFLMHGGSYKDIKDHVRKQLTLFAYWTCYQFESDILAELDLKSSGIEDISSGPDSVPYPQSIEDSLPTSDGHPANADGDKFLFYYSSQINMRTTLNQVQRLLYPPNGHQITTDSWGKLLKIRNNCLDSLGGWRRLLPPKLCWDDTDPPADNILDARLRAKYWGTLYIITRHLLNFALDHLRSPSSFEKDDSSFNNKKPSESYTFEISHKEVLTSCRICIFAAKQSTIAFDTIVFENGKPKNRPMVTNIFGTAHAQFGNMLVLAAVYHSHLSFLIRRDEIINLLDRTIMFLSKLAPISNTLAMDATILRGVLHTLEPSPSTTSSFSSN